MKSKIIFAVMLLFIVASISFASAADNQTEITAADSTDEVLNVPDTGNLTELKGEIENNPQNYTLTKDYSYDPTADDGFDKITIDKENYVLDGQGRTIDAKGSAKFFEITAENVTLKNIIFKNGAANNGSVTFLKAGTLDNCSMINCSSVGGMPGAWFNDGGNVTDCVFENVVGTTYGALFANGTVAIDGCTFTANRAASGNGGAIYSKTSVTVKNSRFKNNRANYGGAICGIGDANVYGCEFESNLAANDGGAVYLPKGSVENCTFKENHATSEGGALALTQTGNVINSSFYKNTAGIKGGAFTSRDGKVTLNGCNFTNNAAVQGGASYISNDAEITDCDFAENGANEGGAIYAKNMKDDISGCAFNDNNGEDGGAIFIDSTFTGKIKDSNFTDNFARNQGGAILTKVALEVNQTTFTKNLANTGAGICSYGNLKVSNSEFSENEATDRTNNVALMGNAELTTENVIPEDLTPYKPVKIEITNVTTEIVYGDTVVITLEATCEGQPISGTLFAVVDEVKYIGSVFNGKGILEINRLDVGDYTTYVTYVGDDNHTTPEEMVSFSVIKKTLELEITNITGTDFGNVTQISVNVTGENITVSQGTVTVTILGVPYTANVNNGTATISIPNLRPGMYAENVIYNGGDNYNSPEALVEFEIAPEEVAIEVEGITGTTYADKIVLTVNAEGKSERIYEGRIKVTVNGNEYSAAVVYGVANVEIEGLNEGDYNATIEYDGGDMYSRPSIDYAFTVLPRDVEIKAVYENITYGDIAEIVIILNSSDYTIDEGRIALTLNGATYYRDVVYGMAAFSFPDLKLATYPIEISFEGGDNYNSQPLDIELNVSQKILELEIINITGTGYAENTEINVRVTGDNIVVNEGGVKITINGNPYTGLVNNGIATISIPNLKPGEYSGNVTYDGGANYNNPTQFVEFEIDPCYVALEVVNITGTTYADTLVMTVNVTSDIEKIYDGTVTVSINGRDYEADVSYGVAKVEIKGLDVGDYFAEITYDGGDTYLAPPIYTIFPIDARKVDLEVVYENITYTDTAEITVNLLADGYIINEGGIYISIDEDIRYVPVEDGSATLKLSGLKAGTYNIGAMFNGGKNYNTGYESAILNVSKLNVSLTVIAGNITYGDTAMIALVVSGEREVNEGTVSARVAGILYTSEVKEGVAVIAVPYLNAGTYKGNVTFKADDNYNMPSEAYEFTVEKATPALTVDYLVNITYGDTMTFTANLTSNGKPVETGYVVVTLGSKSYRAYVENGIAVVEIPNLDANLYTGELTYSGTDNFNSTSQSVLFNVARADTVIIDVSIAGNIYGDVVEITANVTSARGALNVGTVSIPINGKYYTAKVANGIGTIYVPDLDAGFYESTIAFDGGPNYNSAEREVAFEVAKKIVTIRPEYANITYSETAKIIVHVTSGSENMTVGNITATINGRTIKAPVQNGIATIYIAGLDVGTYDVDLAFDGGPNYIKPSETIALNVAQKLVTLMVDSLNYAYGDTIIINVNVTSGKDLINEGTVFMSLNGADYSSPVKNGTATFNVGIFELGTYTGIVDFYGGNNYNQPSSKFIFNVIKRNALIEAKDAKYVINYNYEYNFVLKDSTGTAIANEKVLVYLNSEFLGEYTTSQDGKVAVKMTTKILKAAKSGAKSLVMQFSNVHYNPTSKTVRVNIYKEITKVTAKKKTFKLSLKTKKYTMTLKNKRNKVLKDKKVILKVKGKTYKAKTNSKGKATFKITKLNKKGTFNAVVKYKGSSYYQKKKKKVKITVK